MAIVVDFPMGEGDSDTIRTQLKNRDGSAMDLTDCTVTALLKKITDEPPAVALAVTPDPDQVGNMGYVTVKPFAPGVSTPGLYEIRFKVVDAALDRISVRNYHPHLVIEVTSDPS